MEKLSKIKMTRRELVNEVSPFQISANFLSNINVKWEDLSVYYITLVLILKTCNDRGAFSRRATDMMLC